MTGQLTYRPAEISVTGTGTAGTQEDLSGVCADSLRISAVPHGIAGSVRPPADSEANAPVTPVRNAAAETADSILAGAAQMLHHPADTSSGSADLFSAACASSLSPWRDTTVQAVFGQESTLALPQNVPLRGTDSLTENAVFQSFVLLLAATYALLLYRNLGDVTMLLGRISRDTASGKRLSEDPGGSGFPRFLNIATAIGMLFMGVVVVKYGDSLMPRALTDMFSHGAVLALSLLATLACVAVVCFQLTALRIAGAVMLSQPFVSQLVLLKRTYFSLAVIVTSPALLLFALCPRGTGGVWFVVVAAELAITAVLYLREALNLFLSKKVSILHWFLYLCTVEVFPISLLWLLAAR